jgi:hypothetical protein
VAAGFVAACAAGAENAVAPMDSAASQRRE